MDVAVTHLTRTITDSREMKEFSQEIIKHMREALLDGFRIRTTHYEVTPVGTYALQHTVFIIWEKD